MDGDPTTRVGTRLTVVPPAPTAPVRPAASALSPPVVHAAATRSAFLRLAPVIDELERRGEMRLAGVDLCPADSRPADDELEELGFPRGARAIPPGDGPASERIARMLSGCDRIFVGDRPRAVVIAGGGDGALACALAASRRGIPVARLDAGLRSFDWRSSDEISRVLVDRLSDILLTQSPEAHENLLREGVIDGRVHYVGNPLVDRLRRCAPAAHHRDVRTALGLAAYEYVVVALLQRATVDGAGRAARLVGGLGGLAARAPVVLALPSRTATALADAGIARTAPGIRSAGSLAPLAFLGLAAEAGAIVTDSGSVQEEASALGVPCFTLGTATERPVTLIHGTNTLLGDDAADLAGVAAARRPPAPATIPLWDGRAAGRIADVLVANFALRGHLRAGR